MRSTGSKEPRILGIGGGVASGKSTVAALFEERGIPVILLDDLARELSQKGKPLWKLIVLAFGRFFLDGQGNLERRKLAWLVFRSWPMLFRLNGLAHPLLFWEVRRRCQRFRTDFVVVEGAVLFEAGLCPLLSDLLFVDAPWHVRRERLQKKGLQEKEIVLRLSAQRFLPALRRRASKVLVNDSSTELLVHRVFSLFPDWFSGK
ncbi:dephospho-CoA kinase [Candidatus Caldatribacterium sp. SIUC1]|uniref:dephospho-CoA kinase n=1 Tax=Candidatus Caldatribacterium sp. SIUC1 TaxID=3418365 RepID=UPI003F691CC3